MYEVPFTTKRVESSWSIDEKVGSPFLESHLTFKPPTAVGAGQTTERLVRHGAFTGNQRARTRKQTHCLHLKNMI